MQIKAISTLAEGILLPLSVPIHKDPGVGFLGHHEWTYSSLVDTARQFSSTRSLQVGCLVSAIPEMLFLNIPGKANRESLETTL
ncbi:hypothetical protein CapIbe_018461 [Capra ibex]